MPPHTCEKGYYHKINKHQVLARMWRKGNPTALLVGLWIGAATIENILEISQKIKTRAIILSSNSTSGYFSEENKNTNLRRACILMFSVVLLVMAKIRKQPRGPSIDGCLKEMHHMYKCAVNKWNIGYTLYIEREYVYILCIHYVYSMYTYCVYMCIILCVCVYVYIHTDI